MHGGLGAVDATLSRREASSAFARVALCAEQASRYLVTTPYRRSYWGLSVLWLYLLWLYSYLLWLYLLWLYTYSRRPSRWATWCISS